MERLAEEALEAGAVGVSSGPFTAPGAFAAPGELEALARALLERETLDEKEILEVTGLPPSPPLENTRVPVSDVEPRRDGR